MYVYLCTYLPTYLPTYVVSRQAGKRREFRTYGTTTPRDQGNKAITLG